MQTEQSQNPQLNYPPFVSVPWRPRSPTPAGPGSGIMSPCRAEPGGPERGSGDAAAGTFRTGYCEGPGGDPRDTEQVERYHFRRDKQ